MNKEDMILEYLKKLDAELKGFRSSTDQRFVDAKDELKEIRIDLRSFKDDTKDSFKEVKYTLRLDQEKLDQVYQSKDKNIVSLGRSFVGVNLVLSSLVAFFVSFFMK